MAYHAVNFRASSGFKTDGTGETYCLGEQYPVTRGGIGPFGFNIDLTGNSRDRNSSLDRRLAGGVFRANSAGVFKFYMPLEDGPGTYAVGLALGDEANPQTHLCLVRDGDGGTVLATIDNDTGDAAEPGWLDATGVERIGIPGGLPTYWPNTAETIELTFTGSEMVLDLGNHSGGAEATFIAHVSVEFVSGGGGSTRATPFGHRGTAFNGGKTFLGTLRREALGQACAVGDRIAAAVQREREAFGQRLLASI